MGGTTRRHQRWYAGRTRKRFQMYPDNMERFGFTDKEKCDETFRELRAKRRHVVRYSVSEAGHMIFCIAYPNK